MNAILILHSYRRCPYAIRVRMTLEEKGLHYQVIEENLSNPSPELLILHPEGKVPVLIHDKKVLYESAIITEYLDEVFPTPILRPSTPLARAQLRLMTYRCDTFFKPNLDLYKYEFVQLKSSEQTTLIAQIQGYLNELETRLSDSSYLMGDDFTLADIHIFPFYRQLQKARPDFSQFFQFPQLNLWLERITARPSFKKIMQK